jgi:hypothetical protein
MRLQELNQWNTIYNWGNWLTRGRPRVRKFEKPVTFTIREDFKVTAGFLGCGEDFLEAVDKEFEIEKRSRLVVFRSLARISRIRIGFQSSCFRNVCCTLGRGMFSTGRTIEPQKSL